MAGVLGAVDLPLLVAVVVEELGHEEGVLEMRLRVRGAEEVAARPDLADRVHGLLEVLEARALAQPEEHLHLLGIEHELRKLATSPASDQPAQ